MVKRYKGGLMGSTEVVTSVSDARGMWGIVQATQARNTGNWPGLLATETPGTGSVTVSNVAVTDSNYTVLNDTPNISTTGGFIRITGRGFVSGCVVYVGAIPATTTTFVSSTEVRAVVPAASSNTLMVYVVNPDGSTAIKLNSLVFSGTPSWNTGATLGSQLSDIAFSVQFSATSDSAVTYSLSTGSSLPPGTSLFANGLFTGTVTGISSDTTYSFSVDAIDVESQDTSRTFSVTVSTGDQYFYITPLLLNGEANVWIRDSSTNNFLPTIVADTKPTAFSPYNTNWSAYFDGTNDYLTCTTSTTFGTGDFTVECWVNMPSITNTYSSGIIGTTNYNGIDRGWALDIVGSSGYPRFYLYNSSGTGVTLTSSTLLPANRWTHLAAVRSGTTVTIYMNGVSIASGTNATNDNFSAPIYFGTIATSFAIGVSTYSYAGYISNARVVVGVAVYTGNFTPPTTALGNTQSAGTNISAITGTSTSLLTLQDNRFKDNSVNAFAITRTGDVAIRSFGPFAETDTTTGSGYLDGTGDYLSIGTAANWVSLHNTSAQWTIEFWVYPITYNGSLLETCDSSSQTGIFLGFDANGLLVLQIMRGVTSSFVINGTGNIASPRNVWTHIQLSYDFNLASNNMSMYINGVANTASAGSFNKTGNAPSGSNPTSPLYVGYSTSSQFQGYITDLRIRTGLAVSTAPTLPTTTIANVANTSLLTLQYRTGDNNHRFVDESGNKYPALRTGQVSQGSFSPFSPAGWSAYFDGTGDYLTTSAAALTTTQTTFTIECWIFMTAAPTGSGFCSVVGDMTPTSTTSYWSFGPGAARNLVFQWYDGGPNKTATGATTMALNTWYHIAVSVNANAITLYVNGTSETLSGTTTVTNRAGTTSSITIGQFNTSSANFTGYVSNLSILSGTAKYSGSFTPATSGLAADTTNQVFLFGGTNRFIDQNTATTAKTITRFGDARIQAFSPFRPSGQYSPALHGGSAFFDGSGDYLAAASTANTLLPTSTTNTFTIDGWLYPTALGALKWIFGDMQAAGGINNVSVDLSSSNFVELYWYDGNVKRATSTTAVVLNQWNYFAIVVNNNAITIFVNSTTAGQGGTTTLTTRSLGTTGWAMGAWNSADYYSGFMSGIRWSNGIARTISSIPTAPPTPDANTVFLMNFTHGGIVDASARNVIETLADAKITSLQNKFGTGAMYFDGTGDYLTMRNNPAHGFGTGDFTIECWMFCTDASTYRGLMAQGDGSTTGWFLYFNPNPTPLIIFGYGGSITYGAGVVVIGSWCHVAVTRFGSGSNNLRFYVNGTVVTQVTLTNNLSSTSPTYIGASGGGGYPFAGYLDDVRITSGFARYTGATLTLPTSTFPTK